MEGKKFNVVMDTDENGKPVRKFVPCDEGQTEPVYAVYWDYLLTEKEDIQKAKDTLLESLFNCIRELSEEDEFWIVKETNSSQATIGWKIHIPQMDK